MRKCDIQQPLIFFKYLITDLKSARKMLKKKYIFSHIILEYFFSWDENTF